MEPSSHIRVLLVDDDPEWLKAMTRFISKEPDLRIAGTAMNREEALALVGAMDFDVAVMDLNLTENKFDGITVAIDICLIQSLKVIMLTSFNEEDLIKKAFSIGATNYFSKSKFIELPQAIRNAHRQESPFDVLVKDYVRLRREEQLHMLTPAERDIFRFVEEGNTNANIQKRLYISESTIKNHVNAILKKLGAYSMKEAVEKVRKEDFE